MSQNYSVIVKCRLCHSDKITKAIKFGDVPLANSYPLDPLDKEDTFPLTVMKCCDCGHVQLRETVDPQTLFSNYLYSSSDSPALVRHFRQYAADIVRKIQATEHTQVLEIGCNDGILLKEFANLGLVQLIGVDPAANLAQKAIDSSSAKIITDFFNIDVAKKIKYLHGSCDVICANNTFAHIAQLDSLMEGVRILLHPEGIFVFENAYLLDTIRNLYFDQVYHEHLQYYGIKPLIQYLNKYGLEIFDIERVDVQGGSFRIYAKLTKNKNFEVRPSVGEFLAEEESFGLYKNSTYDDFTFKIINLREEMSRMISEIITQEKTISCYGCPAKFALFSKVFGLSGSHIQYVVDDSPLKQGRFSPGRHIPIVSRQYFLDHPTDYCIISVWNMANAIIAKNPEYQGKFIIPLPQPKILS